MRILYITLLVTPLIFSSCGKCVECHWDGNEWYANGEEFGDRMQEICSDDFESRKDFDEYIDELQDEYDV